MIVARFEPGIECLKVEGLWQHDRGQKLRIEGLDLTGTISVDFSLSSKGEAIPIACITTDGIAEVTIPDNLLAAKQDKDYAIYAYIYRSTEDTGETTEVVVMTVKARPSRQGQDTPGTPDQFSEAIEAVNNAANRAEYAMAMANQSASDMQSSVKQIEANRQDIEALQALGLTVIDGAINMTF